MSTEDPIYPSSQARLTANFTDFDQPSMGPSDVQSVLVTITDPAGVVVVNAAAMSWSSAEAIWFYLWSVPSDAAAKTFRTVTVLTALDGGRQPVYSEVWVEAPPLSPAAMTAQPIGIPPVTRTYLEPWCEESDIPTRRLEDSNGVRLADINLGWMIAASTDALYVLSGRKFRSGRSVIRPSVLGRSNWQTPLLYPYNSLGGFGDAWGFETGWLWSAMGPGWGWGIEATELVLEAPVRRINNVVVDGVALPPNAYAVLDRRRLVRTDGQVWPTSQSMAQDITQPGTCQIDYEWGRTPKELGRLACAELTTELALSFSGQDACKLPARVQNIVTQGVNVAVGSALAFLRESLTGLPIVDLFLQAENPAKKRRPSVFLSPESVLNRST